VRRLLIIAVCVIGYFSYAAADTGQEQAVQFISSWMAQVRGQAPALATTTEIPPIKCGTAAFTARSAYLRNHPELSKVLQNTRPDLSDSYGTTHFLIHYTTTGSDSVYQPGIDSLAGIPRHVTRVADVFEHVWNIEIESLGYQAPPTDFGSGGDDRYDIYLVNLGYGYFGFTAQDSVIGYKAASFIELESNFAESPTYNSRPLDAVKVTAAHEFFHAIQFGYDAFEFDAPNPDDPNTYKPWWYEASSTWMENVVYNSIKDYIGYLPYFYHYMWMGLGAFSYGGTAEALHPYASCVWPMYMTQRFDDLGIMKDIWERCGASDGYNTLPATDDALRTRGSDISRSFLEFEIWNFQTGELADTVHCFTDGRLFPGAETTLYVGNLPGVTPFPLTNIYDYPQEFATNYIIMNSIPTAAGGVIVNFNGQDLPAGLGWHVALLGYRANDSRWEDIQVNPTTGVGAGAWLDWNNYRAVVLIPTFTGLNPIYSNFNYGGTLQYDASLTGGAGIPVFSVQQAYPSPYIINDSDSLTIPYSLDKSYSKSEMEMFIYDASGALVRKIPGEFFLFTDTGRYPLGIQWDGKTYGGDYVASGIYIIVLRAGGNTATGKIAVVNGIK
jgi:hypothetical protein